MAKKKKAEETIQATILKGCAGTHRDGKSFKYRKGEQIDLSASQIEDLGSLVEVEAKSGASKRETR